MASRARVVVHFDDGSTQEFNPNRPRLLLEMEKRYGVQTPERHEHVAWLAHYALARDMPFDEWLDRVEEFESIAAGEDDDDEQQGEGSKDLGEGDRS